MKKIIITLLSFLFSTSVLANDIYITQSGASLNLDVVQDGANNVFGTSSTSAVSYTHLPLPPICSV